MEDTLDELNCLIFLGLHLMHNDIRKGKLESSRLLGLPFLLEDWVGNNGKRLIELRLLNNIRSCRIGFLSLHGTYPYPVASIAKS